MNIKEAKALVIDAGIKLVETGLIARTWGNVSCRVNENTFVITPSGRNYMSLTMDDIVAVTIGDLSYEGDVKPSSEKGIHAEVYKLHPDMNFVIHTHQEKASVIGASELDSIQISGYHPSLDGEVPCAEYALPGTKTLRRNVVDALSSSRTNAVIMKYHGALCFGKDDMETFEVATQLEKACHEFVVDHYLNASGKSDYHPLEMSMFALSQSLGRELVAPHEPYKTYLNSERTEDGFILYSGEEWIEVDRQNSDSCLREERVIYDAIYRNREDIRHIIFISSPEIMAIACSGIELRPLLDDFAQISGTHAKNVDNRQGLIAKALRKSSVVFIKNIGAICCGKTYDEANAVSMVTEKASKALIGASLLGRVKPINPIECMLMRFVYQKKYSKKALEG